MTSRAHTEHQIKKKKLHLIQIGAPWFDLKGWLFSKDSQTLQDDSINDYSSLQKTRCFSSFLLFFGRTQQQSNISFMHLFPQKVSRKEKFYIKGERRQEIDG